MATILRSHAKAHTSFVLRAMRLFNPAQLALFSNHPQPNASIKINADNKAAMGL
jgi:hypothetical protein